MYVGDPFGNVFVMVISSLLEVYACSVVDVVELATSGVVVLEASDEEVVEVVPGNTLESSAQERKETARYLLLVLVGLVVVVEPGVGALARFAARFRVLTLLRTSVFNLIVPTLSSTNTFGGICCCSSVGMVLRVGEDPKLVASHRLKVIITTRGIITSARHIFHMFGEFCPVFDEV